MVRRDARMKVTEQFHLEIKSVLARDAGTYRCEVGGLNLSKRIPFAICTKEPLLPLLL